MVGRLIVHYEVLEELGRGGMGVVYKARDERLGRFVALKTLPKDLRRDASAGSSRKLLKEAQVASALNHPNIVTIYDVLEDEDEEVIVMEYVDGMPLSRMIVPGGLPADLVMHCATQVGDALVTAHDAGIIHRDLKPHNLMITPGTRVKILDFGLAKLKKAAFDDLTKAGASVTGGFVGTYHYAAPEQAMGEAADVRADVFSFSVVLFEMLTGTRPYEGESPLGLLHNMKYGQPRSLQQMCPGLPPSMLSAIRRGLSGFAAQRHPDMRAFLSELTYGTQAAVAVGGSGHSAGFPSMGSQVSGRTPPALGTERTSIAVMPFQSLSLEKEDEYLASGIASEITSALTGVPGLRVASQVAAFRLGDDISNLQAAGSALNARYLLTGTLRRAGNRIRVTAQLSDAVTSTMIWSRSYDRSLEDLFAVQEDIAKSIVAATGGQLIRAGSERLSTAPKESLDAWGLTRRAYHFWNHAFHPAGIQEALMLLHQAVQIDPEYAVAQAYLALYQIETVVNCLAPDPVSLRASAFEAAQKALELAPSDPEVLEVVGLVMLHCKEFEKAVQYLRRSVKVAPFNLVAWGYLGLTLGWAGNDKQTNEGVEILERLLKDTSDHPSVPYWQYFLSGGLMSQGHAAEAAEAARICVEQQPRLFIASISLANALGAMGDVEGAKAAWQAALAVHPLVTMEFYKSEILFMTRTEERGEPHWIGLVRAGIMPSSTA